jgi:hypothetical protein
MYCQRKSKELRIFKNTLVSGGEPVGGRETKIEGTTNQIVETSVDCTKK